MITLEQLHDELLGMAGYIVDYGAIRLGTPQSGRIIKLIGDLTTQLDREAKVPADYPKRSV